MSRRLLLRGAGVAAIGLASAVFFLTRPSPPPVSALDGTFYSDCCAPVRLFRGTLSAGATHATFELRSMKFGLTAYTTPALRVASNGIEAADLANENAIAISDDLGSFTLLDSQRHEHVFHRR